MVKKYIKNAVKVLTIINHECTIRLRRQLSPVLCSVNIFSRRKEHGMSAVDFSNPRYFGQATISVDSKGRIFIPTKWHDQIGESVILHIGLSRMGSGRYLELTTPEVFDAFIDRLDALPSTNRRFDQLKSMILGNSEKIFLDKQSRILLPKNRICESRKRDNPCRQRQISPALGSRCIQAFRRGLRSQQPLQRS